MGASSCITTSTPKEGERVQLRLNPQSHKGGGLKVDTVYSLTVDIGFSPQIERWDHCASVDRSLYMLVNSLN